MKKASRKKTAQPTDRPLDSKISAGNAFEHQVVNLYRSLNYRVTHNIDVLGQQVDFVAEKQIAGGAHVKILGECKYRSHGGVSNQEVQNAIAFFESAKTQLGLTHLVVVSNTSFTASAKATRGSFNNILLKTLDELQNELLEFSTAYTSFTNSYEAERSFRYFVPPSGRGRLPGLSKSETKTFSNLHETLLSWIRDDPSAGCAVILADFGAGKTTLLNQIQYSLASAYLKGTNTLKPIFFPLKSFAQFQDLNQFIEHVLVLQTGTKAAALTFWQLASTGSLLLLLDGFDEVAAKVDERQREELFIALAPLMQTKSKAILTCRPSYFVSTKEYNSLLSYLEETLLGSDLAFTNERQRSLFNKSFVHDSIQKTLKDIYINRLPSQMEATLIATINLELFDERRIKAYLQKFDGEFRALYEADHKKIYETLEKVYDIRDIMKRPIILDMLSSVLLNRKIDLDDANLEVGPSSLYENYTSIYFKLDYDKGDTRRFLSIEERRAFAQMMAYQMLMSGTTEISYGEIASAVRSNWEQISIAENNNISETNFDHVAADIQICTFLTRIGDGSFRFAHISFMEFFSARYLRLLLQRKTINRLLHTAVKWEVLYFLGGFALVDKDFLIVLLQLYRDNCPVDDTNLRRNIAAAILYASPDDVGGAFRDTSLFNLSLSRKAFEETTFSNTIFNNIRAEEIVFRNLELPAAFEQCRIENLHLDSVQLQLSLSDLKSEKWTFAGSRGTLYSPSTGKASSCSALAAARCELTLAIDAVANSVEIDECELIFPRMETNVFYLQRGTINKTILINGTEFSRPVPTGALAENLNLLRGLKFSSCTFVNFPISYACLLELRSSRRLKGCRGLMIVFQVDEQSHAFYDKTTDAAGVSRRLPYIWDDTMVFLDAAIFFTSGPKRLEAMATLSRDISSKISPISSHWHWGSDLRSRLGKPVSHHD